MNMDNVSFRGTSKPIRVGIIGFGDRGSVLHSILKQIQNVIIVAVADTHGQKLQKLQRDDPNLVILSEGEMLQNFLAINMDLAIVATPWEFHVDYSVAAMQSGKHVAVEVPAAMTVDGCWQLVTTSEATGKHCVMLENCCYDYWEMLAIRMAQAGFLGTITNAEGAYIHDLAAGLLVQQWRRDAHIKLDGNLYPTHGLGPVAQALGIGKTDFFEYMVSMSSQEAGLSELRKTQLSPRSKKHDEVYQAGDLNVSLIKTRLGRLITLQHATCSAYPYDRKFMITGTRGSIRANPPGIFLRGVHKHEWGDITPYKSAWENPEWSGLPSQGGHNPDMDRIMLQRLITAMQKGRYPDTNVYDAVDWSVPGPLSVESVATTSVPVVFPYFRINCT